MDDFPFSVLLVFFNEKKKTKPKSQNVKDIT